MFHNRHHYGSAPYTALPPNEAFPKGEEAAKTALELDNTLAEAHVALGCSEMVYDLNLAEARREFSLGLQLHPDYATGHQFSAYYLTAIGDLKGSDAFFFGQGSPMLCGDPLCALQS